MLAVDVNLAERTDLSIKIVVGLAEFAGKFLSRSN